MHIKDVLPPDAIPSIDNPTFDVDYFGELEDDVIVVDANPPRAYPLRILNYHEIVNDDIDGEPIAVTWCPLCGSAIVYDRGIDGQRLTFGVSGKLADDDLVMYDRETGSEWKQSLGHCISGEFVGQELTVRPATMMSFERFRSTHPEGVVLQPTPLESETASDSDDPAPVDYSIEPYERYFESDGFGLHAHRGESSERRWNRTDIAPKAVIIGLEHDDDVLGVPLPMVEQAGGSLHATVGGRAVVVFAVDRSVAVFDDPGFAFTIDDRTVNGDDSTWDIHTGTSHDGRALSPFPWKRVFAFS